MLTSSTSGRTQYQAIDTPYGDVHKADNSKSSIRTIDSPDTLSIPKGPSESLQAKPLDRFSVRKKTGKQPQEPPACDFIIIGAGSAGCVMANRLTESGLNTVTLLEAGPSDDSLLVRTPGAMPAFMVNKRFNWRYKSESVDDIREGKSLCCPRGKTLGGSSSINAMIYIRGHPSDYDNWESQGNRGWGYKDMLPFFKKSEGNSRDPDEYHNNNGPLHVSDADNGYELNKRFVDAAVESGEKFNKDFNGEELEGCGFYQLNIKNGERCSAAEAYLKPAKTRKNLSIECKALVNRILFEEKKAVGVEYCQNGKTKTLLANKEVLVCAGAYNSPQLLMLSGIGDKDELGAHNIDVVHHLPGVGKNLQEHVDAPVLVTSRKKDGVSISPLGLVKMVPDLFRYVVSKTGKLSSSACLAGGFFNSGPAVNVPDMQMHFLPGLLDGYGKNLWLLAKHGLSIRVCVLRPESRGMVSLRSANPRDAPKIVFNLLSEKKDQETLVSGIKLARTFLATQAFSDYYQQEIHPGKDVVSDEDLLSACKKKLGTVFHPVGTCKMGNDDMAVVDQSLRVRGVQHLRVIDASIMPNVISGNTNAATIAIGEKIAAEMIAELQRAKACPGTLKSDAGTVSQ